MRRPCRRERVRARDGAEDDAVASPGGRKGEGVGAGVDPTGGHVDRNCGHVRVEDTRFAELLLLTVSKLKVVAPEMEESRPPSNWIVLVPAVSAPLLIQFP